jgi:hypothetical protein
LCEGNERSEKDPKLGKPVPRASKATGLRLSTPGGRSLKQGIRGLFGEIRKRKFNGRSKERPKRRLEKKDQKERPKRRLEKQDQNEGWKSKTKKRL